MDANAPIHELKKRIYEENAPQLPNVTATTMDVYSTQNFPGGWAKLNPRDFLVDIETPQAVAPLLPTKRIGHYFPSDIPPFDSDVVHVVTRRLVEVLRDEVPILNETREEELDRVGRLQGALGLRIVWEMASHRDHINFSKEHDYQGAQWLEYDHFGHSRVFIGDKTTWKKLFIAADKALLEAEGRVGSRFIEGFVWLQDGITLHVQIGT